MESVCAYEQLCKKSDDDKDDLIDDAVTDSGKHYVTSVSPLTFVVL